MRASVWTWVLALCAGCATPGSRAHEPVTPGGVVAPRGAPAQGERARPAPGAPLEELVGFASAHHPRLRADHARWRAQAAAARGEGRWANPRVGYAFAPLPIETRLGPNHHTFSASQKIPWPTRAGAQQSAAATEADALAHDYDARYLVTRLDVELAYHSLYALHAEREVLTRELAVLDALEAGLGGRVEVGARPSSELARVGLVRARVADRLGSLDAARAALEARLGEAMGLAGPHRVVFEGAPDPGAPLPAPEALEDMLAGAPTPPHLRALGARVEAQRGRRALAELDRMPDFEVGAQWSLIDEGDAMAQERGRDAVVLRVGVSVPIWEASTAARIDASDARVAQAQATYEAERRRWLSGLRATLSRALDADRRVVLLEGTLLAQARATHEMVRGDYEAGRAELGALLSAVRDIHELELELVRARARRAQERARWRALLGRPSHQEQP